MANVNHPLFQGVPSLWLLVRSIYTIVIVYEIDIMCVLHRMSMGVAVENFSLKGSQALGVLERWGIEGEFLGECSI